LHFSRFSCRLSLADDDGIGDRDRIGSDRDRLGGDPQTARREIVVEADAERGADSRAEPREISFLAFLYSSSREFR
jgi:hypothetical protein